VEKGKNQKGEGKSSRRGEAQKEIPSIRRSEGSARGKASLRRPLRRKGGYFRRKCASKKKERPREKRPADVRGGNFTEKSTAPRPESVSEGKKPFSEGGNEEPLKTSHRKGGRLCPKKKGDRVKKEGKGVGPPSQKRSGSVSPEKEKRTIGFCRESKK